MPFPLESPYDEGRIRAYAEWKREGRGDPNGPWLLCKSLPPPAYARGKGKGGHKWMRKGKSRREGESSAAHLPFLSSCFSPGALNLLCTWVPRGRGREGRTQVRIMQSRGFPNKKQKNTKNHSLFWHASPVHPGLQRQTPSAHLPRPLQSATGHSSARTSHSAPFQPSEQWQRPPPYTPWPEHSTGHTPRIKEKHTDN